MESHAITVWRQNQDIQLLYRFGGTAAAAPPPFRPSDPALCGSRSLVTPYYCRLGDLLCFVFIVWLLCVWFFCVLCVPSVLWCCWLGLLTCKNRLPYNLYCVGGDVKHYSIQSNPIQCCTVTLISGELHRFMDRLKFNRTHCATRVYKPAGSRKEGHRLSHIWLAINVNVT